MNHFFTLSAPKSVLLAERLQVLEAEVSARLEQEKQAGRTLQYTKVFLSDAANQQKALLDSPLYRDHLSKAPCTFVGQVPLDGSKITLLLKTDERQEACLFHSLRLDEAEAAGKDSYAQTRLLFERYLGILAEKGLRMDVHCVRTWIYVRDIDANYAGVVRARNDVFDREGLTIDTHFIASTGIGGRSEARHALVGMDFLTYPDIEEQQKHYLKAPDFLGSPHDYGVAFERGTALKTADGTKLFISGTASIDKSGKILHEGQVLRQTGRLLENIDALLHDGGASLEDAGYFIIYLRDLSDYAAVAGYMRSRFPDKPLVILLAEVCRPGWLIEMECTAWVPAK